MKSTGGHTIDGTHSEYAVEHSFHDENIEGTAVEHSSIIDDKADKHFKDSAESCLVYKRLCARWRKRREAYEKVLDEEHRLEQEEDIQIQEARIKEMTSNAKDCFKMALSRLYEDEVKESESSTNVLLLPTVKSEEGDEGKQLDNLGIRGIQRVGVQRMLRSLKIEKCKALNDACTYRDIAERLKKNRDDLHRMSNKVEVVQDYWRNQLYEGRSRSEKLVKLALSGSQN